MATKDKAVLKKKKKKWISVIAKGAFDNQIIGEIPVEEISALKGRNITINLMNLTGDIKRQHINLKFLIENLDDNNAYAKPVMYKLSPGFIKRLVRRDKNKIDDSFTMKTSDGVSVRLKPMLVTNIKTNRSVRSELLRETRRVIKDKVSSTSFVQIMNETIEYSLQKLIRERLHKIFPVKNAEIRVLEIIPDSKVTVDSKLVKQERKREEASSEEESAEEETAEEPQKQEESAE